LSSHISDSLWRMRYLVSRSHLGARGFSILAFGCAAFIIGYWYVPAQFNAAAANVSSDAEMRLFFLFAGSLIFVGASFLSGRVKLIALVVVGKALGLYGMFLLLTTQTLYPVYPGYEQVDAGAVLLFLMLILDFTIMPIWLYKYFGKVAERNFLIPDTAKA